MSIDLTTRLGNLELCSPIIVGSCPMTADEMQRISMISNGAGAIVLPSIGTWENQDKLTAYLDRLSRIAGNTSIPVIASIKADTKNNQWFEIPAKIEAAGAAAIEISMQYCPMTETDPREIEDGLVRMTQEADRFTDVPLFLKLTPNFTSISHLARQFNGFVQGLIMFGRTPVIDIELDNLELTTQWGLTQSGSVVRSLEPLMRARCEYQDMPLIACGGIGTSQDLVKALLAGANAAMVTSALYRDGTSVIGNLKEGLMQFMSHRGVSNIGELQSLCPSLEKIRSEIDSCNYAANVSHQEVAQTRDQGETMHGDRFGHPVN